jgi:hypothetical protein
MKRVLSLLLVLSLCVFAIGCPGGEETVTEGEGVETPAANGTTPVAAPKPGTFKEGIDSGRAADGSDEDK